MQLHVLYPPSPLPPHPHTHSYMHTHPSMCTDGTACVWDVDSSNVLLKYCGHSGSVNSLSFHPHEPLACTGSGDTSAHIWNCSVSIPRQRNSTVMEKLVQTVPYYYTCIGGGVYHIVGNFGKVFNLVIWRIFQRLRNFLSRQFKLNACGPMTLIIQIAKFKSCQYHMRAVLPNF